MPSLKNHIADTHTHIRTHTHTHTHAQACSSSCWSHTALRQLSPEETKGSKTLHAAQRWSQADCPPVTVIPQAPTHTSPLLYTPHHATTHLRLYRGQKVLIHHFRWRPAHLSTFSQYPSPSTQSIHQISLSSSSSTLRGLCIQSVQPIKVKNQPGCLINIFISDRYSIHWRKARLHQHQLLGPEVLASGKMRNIITRDTNENKTNHQETRAEIKALCACHFKPADCSSGLWDGCRERNWVIGIDETFKRSHE